MTDLEQKGGTESVNLQAAGNINIVTGVTVNEARAIALDVFHANAFALVGEAEAIRDRRLREFSEHLVSTIFARAPALLTKFRDPEFLPVLYDTQKAHTSIDDANVESVLIDLLMTRAAEPAKTLKQVVIDDAIRLVPRISPRHLDLLSLVFSVAFHCESDVDGAASLLAYVRRAVRPFLFALPVPEDARAHLVYVGCLLKVGRPVESETGLEKEAVHSAFCMNYPQTFGFPGKVPFPAPPAYAPRGSFKDDESWEERQRFFKRDAERYETERKLYDDVYTETRRGAQRAQDFVLNIPELRPLLAAWPLLYDWALTDVGFALATANLACRTDRIVPLERWLAYKW